MLFSSAAKTGKVVGPVVPNDNGSIRDSYDPRHMIRSSCMPQAIQASCHFQRRATIKREHIGMDSTEVYENMSQMKQALALPRLIPDVPVNMTATPYYLSQTQALDERTVIDVNLLQTKSRYG